MATKKPESVEAFVLVDCVFGMAGEVVTLSQADAEAGANAGRLDLHIDAVSHAKKLAAKEQARAANYDKQYLGIGAIKAEPDAK